MWEACEHKALSVGSCVHPSNLLLCIPEAGTLVPHRHSLLAGLPSLAPASSSSPLSPFSPDPGFPPPCPVSKASGCSRYSSPTHAPLPAPSSSVGGSSACLAPAQPSGLIVMSGPQGNLLHLQTYAHDNRSHHSLSVTPARASHGWGRGHLW